MQIASTPFIVVDTETTGRSSRTDRIIEIAAVKVVGGEIIDEFSQLINPGRIIPGRITQLTSISNGMVYGMPQAAEAFPVFLDFLGDGILVAHNASFDISFINAELMRIGATPLENPSVCTLRLARRLLRGLRSKGLTSIAAFYGIEIEGRHRALGDARATAGVLNRFLAQLKSELNITHRDDLIRFQFTSYAPEKGTKKRLVQLRDTCVPSIPESPGVYMYKGKNDQVIYVGKAKNLRSRVRSYFTSIEAHTTHTRKLLERINAIEWRSMDSELEALIEESRLIKTLRPRFNRAQKYYRNRPFIKISTSEEFPAVTLTSYLVDDGAEYFGPMGSKREGNLVIDLINRFYLLRECGQGTFNRHKKCMYLDLNRCQGPCIESISSESYAVEVHRVKLFLMGMNCDVVLERLSQEMVRASTEMDYEQAALYRDQLEMILNLMARQECIAAPVLEHHAVVIDRSIKDGKLRLLMIRYGRLVHTMVLPVSPDKDCMESIRVALAAHMMEEGERPVRYFKAEIEEIRLLAHWLFVNKERLVKIDYARGMGLNEYASLIWNDLNVPEIV